MVESAGPRDPPMATVTSMCLANCLEVSVFPAITRRLTGEMDV